MPFFAKDGLELELEVNNLVLPGEAIVGAFHVWILEDAITCTAVRLKMEGVETAQVAYMDGETARSVNPPCGPGAAPPAAVLPAPSSSRSVVASASTTVQPQVATQRFTHFERSITLAGDETTGGGRGSLVLRRGKLSFPIRIDCPINLPPSYDTRGGRSSALDTSAPNASSTHSSSSCGGGVRGGRQPISKSDRRAVEEDQQRALLEQSSYAALVYTLTAYVEIPLSFDAVVQQTVTVCAMLPFDVYEEGRRRYWDRGTVCQPLQGVYAMSGASSRRNSGMRVRDLSGSASVMTSLETTLNRETALVIDGGKQKAEARIEEGKEVGHAQTQTHHSDGAANHEEDEEEEDEEEEEMCTSLEVFQTALLLPPTGTGFNVPVPPVPECYPGETSPYATLECAPPDMSPVSCREMIARLRVQNHTPHRIRSVRVTLEQLVTIRVATTVTESVMRQSPYRPPPPPSPPYHVVTQSIPVATTEYVPDTGLLLPGEDITFEVRLRGPRGLATNEARAQLPIPSLHTPLCSTSTSLNISYPAILSRLPEPVTVSDLVIISSYVDDTNQVPANLEFVCTV